MIRLAQIPDQPVWSELRYQLWPHESVAQHLADLRAWEGKHGFQGWLAIEDGKPIAFAEATIRPFANGCDSQPVAFLEGIWVEEAWRKQGVGRSLVSAVEAWAKAKGIFELGSDALIDNSLSLRVHQRWGFEEMERVVCFRKLC